MRMIDSETVHRILTWPEALEAMRAGHLRPKAKIARFLLEQPRDGGHPDLVMAVPAWQRGEALGMKVVTSFPGNIETYGVPTVDALYIVFEPRTGKPQAVIDGESLIFRKTATDTALGADFLAPRNAKTLLMVGAGALAPYLIESLVSVRPSLERIIVWNRTPERADILVGSLRARGGSAETAGDLDAVLPQADIVISATMAETPIIKGELVAPGAHVGLVGSFTPQMREGDDALLTRAAIFVDDYVCLERSGEFIEPLSQGVIARSDVLADLFALCRGEFAHNPDHRPTLFKNGGAGHLDLFMANYVVSRM